MDRKNEFVCKRTRMAVYLIQCGFEMKGVEIDKDNPSFNVYLFDATPELYKAVLDFNAGKNV